MQWFIVYGYGKSQYCAKFKTSRLVYTLLSSTQNFLSPFEFVNHYFLRFSESLA